MLSTAILFFEKDIRKLKRIVTIGLAQPPHQSSCIQGLYERETSRRKNPAHARGGLEVATQNSRATSRASSTSLLHLFIFVLFLSSTYPLCFILVLFILGFF